MKQILEIEDLHVSLKTAQGLQPILHGVHFAIDQGEAFALIGGSGSGKTITAQSILQLLGHSGVVTKGQILFEKEPLHTKTMKEMRTIRGKKIGMVFQDPMTSLNPTLSVGWQIAEAVRVHEPLSARAARLRALELMKHVGITDAAQRYHAHPFQLSGGMRQRILIAIALACRPTLLIADEPTTALDATIQAQILELLRQICKETGMSLLLITHDLGVVASLCDRAAVMDRGKIVEIDTVENLFKAPKHPTTIALFKPVIATC
jgi:ABC-type dipeptide/oligopeptide/nickel transport system ATPase component